MRIAPLVAKDILFKTLTLPKVKQDLRSMSPPEGISL